MQETITKEYIKNILLENDYPVSEGANYISTAARFRNGDSANAVAIYFGENRVYDFVESKSYNITDFLSIVTGKPSEELKKSLEENNVNLITTTQPKIKQSKVFPSSILNDLVPIYDYWIDRGISESVLKELRCGIYVNGKGLFRNKFVFPIINSKDQITMLACRDISGRDTKFRWILRGQKETPYPAFINNKDITSKKEVILVEGISDQITLTSCGIRNAICMFGTECGLPIINYLLKKDNIKIIINNNNDDAGRMSAIKVHKRLSKYFNRNNIIVKSAPDGFKDMNEFLVARGKESLIEWYNSIDKK